MKRIAIFGGSFNSPTCAHVHAAGELVTRYDEVIIVPCGGEREDKPSLKTASDTNRAAMALLAFRGLRAEVDLFDLNHCGFTRTIDLLERYRYLGEVWFAIGADIFCGFAEGKSEIQRWDGGEQLLAVARFTVFTRTGFDLSAEDRAMMPQHEIIKIADGVSSSEIRRRINAGQSVSGLIPTGVEKYINKKIT